MPSVLPVKRTALAAQDGITDWKLRHDFTTVARGVVIPTPDNHDPSAFGGFGLDGVTRAWANHLNHPDAVIGGWPAGEIHGLKPDWGDSAPVLLLTGRRRHGSLISATAATTPLRPVFRPLPPELETHTPCHRFPRMRVVTPPVAAVQCLWTILGGRHRWWAHDVPGMSFDEVCSVQFLDAFTQATWVTHAEILAASKARIPRSVLMPLLELSDDGAQSPMETVMRLIVRDLLPEPYRWRSQVRVDLLPDAARGWTPKTLPDLGCPELKIALYYDGGHHSEGSQPEIDFNQFHALRDLGWEVIRFTKDHLRSPGAMRELVLNSIRRALQHQ
ncbi:hypothetical protein A606_02965 [Corynebacterium terpenotabidum Y-11]|uniref:DUF559 domain-containing protein n=1 Tax=Corynebacterium terpenotabidum Y-11 TaxID=1200352 RepID=S4XCC2_9CORY|nr:hypothetical protein A606_02965 [Corynebacterium terpenotabidum Y-11]